MRCIRNVPSVMELTIITLMLKKSVCIVWVEVGGWLLRVSALAKLLEDEPGALGGSVARPGSKGLGWGAAC